jgi:hypothetical protein
MAATPLAILAGAVAQAGAALSSAAVQPSELTGFPAIKITGNTVVSPLGRAIRAVARGFVSITNNELTSGGVETGDGMNDAAVLILDLGFTYEIAEFSISAAWVSISQARLLSLTAHAGRRNPVHDNQVLLAPPVQRGRIRLQFRRTAFARDVAFEDNQCELGWEQEFFSSTD